MIDDKTQIAILTGIIFGGLMGAGIGIVTAIISGQNVGSVDSTQVPKDTA